MQETKPGSIRPELIRAYEENRKREAQRNAQRGAIRLFRQAARDVEGKNPSAAAEKLIEALAKPDADAATAALQELETGIQELQLTLETVRDVIADCREDLRPES